MPRQLYPGELKLKFHTSNDKAKEAKRRANTRIQVANLQQSHSQEQIARANQLKTQWRMKQR